MSFTADPLPECPECGSSPRTSPRPPDLGRLALACGLMRSLAYVANCAEAVAARDHSGADDDILKAVDELRGALLRLRASMPPI